MWQLRHDVQTSCAAAANAQGMHATSEALKCIKIAGGQRRQLVTVGDDHHSGLSIIVTPLQRWCAYHDLTLPAVMVLSMMLEDLALCPTIRV